MPPPLPDDDATPPPIHTVATCGFDTTTFALSTSASVGAQGVPFDAFAAGNDSCTTATAAFDYQIADVDGDGLPDLLVTSACNDPTIGPDAYLVYPNTSTGFGAPIRYELPDLSNTPGCVTSALVDIDGDYALDYVVTSLCTDASVGTSQWLVYRNTGGAFAGTAASYTLPANATVHTFSSLEVDAASCTGNQPAYGFYDVTGDHIADIVETTACDDATVGVTSWRVFPGSATGVGSPIAFTLPGINVYPSPLHGTFACGQTLTPTYTVLDFDGDLKPDLVVTKSCTDTNVGVGYWSVFTNTGTGFSSQPSSPTLPVLASEPSGAFSDVAASTACTTAATLNHTLVDVDGDFKPDLVITSTCGDATIGVNLWLVFPNTGTTFSGALAYTLPGALGATSSNPASALDSALACTAPRATPAFDAAHFLDAKLEIIETQSCTDTTVGTSQWLVFSPTCPTSNDQ